MYMMAIPLEAARRLHVEYGKSGGYSQVTLSARRPDDVPAIAAAVRRMGHNIEEGERTAAERVGAIIAVTTGALVFLAVVMCVLAALAIARSLSASVRGRSREIAVLQALGAAPADVHRVVLLEGRDHRPPRRPPWHPLVPGARPARRPARAGTVARFSVPSRYLLRLPGMAPCPRCRRPRGGGGARRAAPASAAARIEPARTLS